MALKVSFEEVPPAVRGRRSADPAVTEFIEAVKENKNKAARWPKAGKAGVLASSLRSHLQRRGYDLAHWKVETRTLDQGEGAAWLTYVGPSPSSSSNGGSPKKVSRRK